MNHHKHHQTDNSNGMQYSPLPLKGILLAGGTGTRLYPITMGISKQLLPVYDKPMIYYPLSVLMLAGIQDILIITTPQDEALFKRLLGDGRDYGVRFSYAIQEEAKGIAHALVVAKEFVENSRICLVLGDNLFYGQGFSGMLKAAAKTTSGASIFTYPVKDVRRFGAATLGDDGQVIELVEKPDQEKSGLAVTGLYFFDPQAVGLAQQLKPSTRGELEIIDLLQKYRQQNQLHTHTLGRGFTWLDMGTSSALLDASHFVKALEEGQGFKVACLEEIAWGQGWIDAKQVQARVDLLAGSSYGDYLSQILASKNKL